MIGKRLAGSLTLLSLVAGFLIALPMAVPAGASAKPKTVSAWYMDTVADNTLENMGCDQANRVDNDTDPNDGVVILTFGSPKPIDTELSTNAVSLFHGYDESGQWAAVWKVQDAAVDYSRGFHNCLNEPASNVDYTLSLGLNNSYPDGNNPWNLDWSNSRIAAHGTAWGDMVANVRSTQTSNGWSSEILAEGSVDAEQGYASPGETDAWVEAFDAVTSSTGFLRNFGSANGCPQFGQGGTGCDGVWTQQDYFHISWGVDVSVPQPQIYNNAMAEEWVLISLWGYNNTQHGAMGMRGPTSENQACGQIGCGSGFDYTPQQAWDHLEARMADRPVTQYPLSRSIDIKWLNP
jgi:hypothetical protein